MTRRPFNFLAVLSVLPFAAAGALWVRSHWVRDMVGVTFGTQSVWATSGNGTVELELLSWPAWEGYSWRRFQFPAAPHGGLTRPGTGAGGAARPGAGGFGAYRAQTGRGTPRRGVVFPHWAMLPPAAALPAAWLVRRRRGQRRRRSGLCPACGYDLRATPGRCPECGAATSVSLST